MINIDGEQVEIQEAWVEDTGASQGQQSNQSDKEKVLSVSLTSMIALGAMVATKLVIPSRLAYYSLRNENRAIEPFRIAFGSSVIVSEDLFNVFFAMFNCRNLIAIIMSDMYWKLHEGLYRIVGGQETSSSTSVPIEENQIQGSQVDPISPGLPTNTHHI